MSLPKHLQAGLTPDEMAFLAEDEHIQIVPFFSMSRVRLLSGIYGPFTPPSPCSVPLWLGLSLKRKRKCRLVVPEWLTTEKMQEILREEKDNSEGFLKLPRHFIEISKAVLDLASDDVQSPSAIRALLKDLREVRQAKVRTGLQSEGVMQGNYLQVSNLTPTEILELKPFLVKAMGIMQSLEPKARDEDEEMGDSQL